ncbi:hypothetical protein [Fluviispira vulneris]|uniref:hypothetical protein n=1 Tax=Fluviispira vulneris TaxID=2763012 RepID=UPI001648593B|nr:hypothetical protein [Fluviispira vulneris]
MLTKNLVVLFVYFLFIFSKINVYAEQAYTYCVTEDGNWDWLYDKYQLEFDQYTSLRDPKYDEIRRNIVNGDWIYSSVNGYSIYILLIEEEKAKELEERCKNQKSKYNKKYIYAQPIFYYIGIFPSGYAYFGTKNNNNNNIISRKGYLYESIDYVRM